MKPLIILKPFLHRRGEQIGIYFKNDPQLNVLVHSKAGGTWSRTGKCWYIPMTRVAFDNLKTVVNEVATLQTDELRKYLDEKNRKLSGIINPDKSLLRAGKAQNENFLKATTGILPVNRHVLASMHQQLKLLTYSSSTARTYLGEMTQLLSTIGDIPADELRPEHLKRYLVYCYEKLGLKENTLHSRINAIYPVGLKNYSHVLLCLCSIK